MVYKRYIKVKGKLYGPYYYKSRREGRKVRSVYVGPNDKEKKEKVVGENINWAGKHKKSFLIFGIILGIFLLLLLGNFRYANYESITGKPIYSPEEVNPRDVRIAKQIADREIISNVNVSEEIDLDITRDSWTRIIFFGERNKVMRFEVPEGDVDLYFNLLDYNRFIEEGVEKEIIPEDFSMKIGKSEEKYKWGYNIILTDPKLMVEIDVDSGEEIVIIDGQTLKVGENYLSFADLADAGYTVSMNEPVILEEIIVGEEEEEFEENMSEEWWEGTPGYVIPGKRDGWFTPVNPVEPEVPYVPPSEGSYTYIDQGSYTYVDEGSYTYIDQGSYTYIPPDEPKEEPKPYEPLPPPPPPPWSGGSLSLLDHILGSAVRTITSFLINGVRGITGLAVEDNRISVYIQKDFTGIAEIGDLINLDPILIRILAGEEKNVSACGTLSDAGTTYTLAQPLSTDDNCLIIGADDITIDMNGYSITGDGDNQLDTGIINIGHSGLEIINGHISGFGTGIKQQGSDGNFYNLTMQIGVSGETVNVKGISIIGNNNVIDKIDSSASADCSSTSWCYGYGIYIEGDNNLIENSEFFGACSGPGPEQKRGYGVYLFESSNNNITNTLSRSSTNDVFLTYSSINNVFLNTTYNTSSESVSYNSELIRKWYYRSYVNDTEGNTIGDANVTAYNILGNYELNLLTSLNGWTRINGITDYVNSGGAKTFYSPYLISAIHPAYLIKRKSYDATNMQNNLKDIFTLSSPNVSSCRVLDQENAEYKQIKDIIQNVSANCIRIISENITFDCQGYFISSEIGVSGIYSNQEGTIIKNCNVNMGDSGGSGIKFSRSNNSYVFDSVLNNQYIGLFVGSSDYIYVTGVRADSNTYGIYLGSNDYVYITNSSASSNYYGLFSGSTDYLSVRNSNFSGNTDDVQLFINSTNVIFIDVFYDILKEYVDSDSILRRKWSYRAHVSDALGNNVGNANVSIYGINYITLSLITDSGGWTPITSLWDYVNNKGNRIYYNNYVLDVIINESSKLHDQHKLDISEKQAFLDDSFILQEDYDPPVMSGVNWTAAPYRITINWSTDEVSDSRLTLWSSPPQTFVYERLVTSHSVTLGTLLPLTTYYFNYTSCDSVGNCNTNFGGNFTIPATGTATGSFGGGSYCVSNIICSQWSECVEGSQSRTCYDSNECEGSGEFGEIKSCGEEDEEAVKVEKIEVPLPVIQEETGLDCSPDWQCGEWSECEIVYDFGNLAEEKVFLKGEQKRVCEDRNQCLYDKIERKKCDTKAPVVAEKVVKCFKDYIEIRDEGGMLISRLEILDGTYKKLNIQMLIAGEYCPYCYDGIRNYDEDEVDCVYEEGSCPICGAVQPSLGINFSLILILFLSVVLCFLIALCFFFWRRLEMSEKRLEKNGKLSG